MFSSELLFCYFVLYFSTFLRLVLKFKLEVSHQLSKKVEDENNQHCNNFVSLACCRGKDSSSRSQKLRPHHNHVQNSSSSCSSYSWKYFILWLYQLLHLTRFFFQQVVIDCEFVLLPPSFTSSNLYTCNSFFLNIQALSRVISVTGTHDEGKSNLDVKRLQITNKNVFYIPKGIEKFFPNLEMIFIYHAGLKEISSADLSPFPNLINVDFYFNEIENLPADLFSKNAKIEYIDFGQNKFSKVRKDLLKPLTNLKRAGFQKNVCINAFAQFSAGILALQNELNKLCV